MFRLGRMRCWETMTSFSLKLAARSKRLRSGMLLCLCDHCWGWANGYEGRHGSAEAVELRCLAPFRGAERGGVEGEIGRYDAGDAAEVSRRIRTSAGREIAIEHIVELYHDVVREFEEDVTRDREAEARAEAAYLQQLSKHYESERDSIFNSRTFLWRKRMLNSRFGGLLRSLANRL